MTTENFPERRLGAAPAIVPELEAVPNLGPEIKFIQWNIFHGSPIEPVLNNIAEADIVTLQEAAIARPGYHSDDGLLNSIHKETDFKYFVFARSHTLIPREGLFAGWVTVRDALVTASKYPIVDSRTVTLSRNEAYDLDHDGERHVPYLEATIKTSENGKLLVVGNTHRSIPLFTNIRNGVLKRETWRMNEAIEEAGNSMIVAGDFNAPWFMRHILGTSKKLGRVDLGLARKTVRPGSFKGIPLPQMRVDYLFATPNINVMETEVRNPANNPSDHNILAATIQQTNI